MRIVIKIGSRALTNEDGTVNDSVILGLAREVQSLRKNGIEAVIVSSGAVRTGRNSVRKDFRLDVPSGIHYDRQILMEQVLASVGQAELIAAYVKAFRNGDKSGCAQLLVTCSDFAEHDSYVSLKAVTENLLRAGIVPILNENDVLAPNEVDLGDNDQLAALVGAMIGSEKVILLTNVDGFYDGQPDDPNSQIVSVITDTGQFSNLVDDSSSTGKGGMSSKLSTAELVTSLGMDLHIASGLAPGVISDIIAGKDAGTFFPRRRTKLTSGIKRWLATAALSDGKIVVSTTLADLLRQKRSASVLLAGVESVEGNFPTKAVVEIYDDEGNRLGKGRVNYSSQTIKRKLKQGKTNRETKGGQVNNEDIIHYNYMVFC